MVKLNVVSNQLIAWKWVNDYVLEMIEFERGYLNIRLLSL